MDSKLKVKELGLPHAPYSMVDSKGHHVATLYHHKYSHKFAELFASISDIENLLWSILEEVENKDVNSTVSIELMSEITRLLLKFNADENTPKDWKDVIFEKTKHIKNKGILNNNNNDNKKTD